ncbi:MAG: HAD-IA family hydrolase [Nocardioides sp.]
MSRIEHVLFDADGVLQDVPGGWQVAMERHLGDRAEEFLRQTWNDELPTLAGRADYLPMLAATLAEYGVTTPVEAVFADVWHNIVVVEETFEVVDALRLAGYGVHLGTNQEQHRADHMRTGLGYHELFDVSCYSYELGVAKPDPGFFTRAADKIGATPAQILFVDDTAANVEGARSAGLPAEQWDFEQGLDRLLSLLRGHGIELTLPPRTP